ncbi:MAG: hypothetical protein WC558_00705 [Patulibacter sp.]
MTAATPARPRPLRTIFGLALITIGVCLLCWAVFNVLRGPGSCGGDAPACPDGFVSALLGGFAAFFVMLPIGIALSPKVVGLAPAVTALISGSLAATVYVSRFVADPLTESTVGTWIGVVILGVISLLGVFLTLVAGPAATAVASGSGRVAVAARAKAEAASASSTTSSSGSPQRPGGTSGVSAKRPGGAGSAPPADPGMTAIHDLLLHGLANGELATKVEVGRIDPDHKADVRRLLDLHQRGVIDDDALRDGLAALRTT